jgi:hypothetical protein
MSTHQSTRPYLAAAVVAGLALSAAAVQPAAAAPAAATSADRSSVTYREREPAGVSGPNDRAKRAERVRALGSGAGRAHDVRVVGRIAQLDGTTTTARPAYPEDNGSIPLASDTGLRGPGTITTTGTLGDGPHGPGGDATNDFDFYAVDLPAHTRVVADTSGSSPEAATGLVVYDAQGSQVAVGTESGSTPGTSRLSVTPREPGRYYVMVAGNAPISPQPSDPFDSGSGAGGAATGDYALSVSVEPADRDQYAVKLRAGDVLGAAVDGAADTVRVSTPSGQERMGSVGVDAATLYPKRSPLPGGTASVAYVAERAGWYTVSVDGDPGRYELRLGAHRPGTEGDGRQTVLVDFDGGRVDTRPWHGPGKRTISPFSAFLERWGIAPSREKAMTRKVTREVRDALVGEVARRGSLDVRVVSSETHPHLRGKKNVSTVYVGGTVEEAGVDTIGISEGVDPGNFDHEDTALALLDRLSDTANRTFSLNHYLGAGSDREGFIAQGVANIAAHEVAHNLGNFHTDNREIDQLMDSAGRTGFAEIYGVGPDGVGGTADDVNLSLGTDRFAQTEGFTGIEDTRNNTRWAFPRR